MRYLLVEDNADLAAALAGRFALAGHVVDHADCLTDAELATRTTDYDLILLDIMLPDGDGRSFLKRHRAADNPTPVIVLTARSEVSDRVGLLDLGADDYITKPFDYTELEARVRAVLRRLGGAAANTREFAGLSFDSTTGMISAAGCSEQLRNRETRLLEVFFAAPGQVFSKSHLMDRLFSFSDDVSENAIEVYVGRLRRKLAPSEATIETVRGLGYRMVRRE
ncbi:response regulator transcription factor [Roseobacter ponti]|uniref:Response regulator transcription factor n=1 Tax=Roseobacter ponti TaxID=1891787 RepID=A0A858SN71_9RHOB|nr:response regulator transcription factor [Roseobacter ponti]QJF50125.1 response regulator transcription factor [Roseobacter ponti]